jgi:hypothetical protein
MAVVIPILVVVYGLIIWGLWFIFRRLRVSSKWAVFLAFLIFGICTGVWAALISEYDSSVFVNLPGVLFGEGIYHWSINLFGDPGSFDAHHTIPWFLRVPQVYVPATAVLWGSLGVIVQVLLNRHRKGESSNLRTKEESL